MSNANVQALARAGQVLPGGVSSPVRAFGAVGGWPLFLRRGTGCHVVDLDDRVYVDYLGAWGAMILGHAHPAVVQAATAALRDGSVHGLSHPGEAALAEAVRERVPGLERIRFTNSGTEAVMTAIRLARAVTHREEILMFDGGWHGHADPVLVHPSFPGGGGHGTAGVPAGTAVLTRTVPYNSVEHLEQVVQRYGDRLAAIIVEPVAGNMGVVPPDPEFLPGLRRAADRCGARLIFDEVITGFRVARGGAIERFGIMPDLVTYGKILGGGFPVGAVAGRAVDLDRLAPAGPVMHGGTFAGNPVTMAAGLATLTHLTPAVYDALEREGGYLAAGLAESLPDATVQRVGSMLSVFFTSGPVRDAEASRRSDRSAFALFFQGMRERGILLPPSGEESWFLSVAHDREVLDATLTATAEVSATLTRSARS